MEILNLWQKTLDAMESSSRENDNFATKVISMKNVEKNVKAIRRKNQNYFCSKLIIWATSLKLPCLEKFLKFWPRVYKEWHIWRNNYHYHYEQFGILFYMLFRIYNMSETSDAHLNTKLCTENWENLNF